MNKYIKLSFVFAAIIGIIVALSYIGNREINPDPDPDSDTELSKLHNTIEETWGNANGWDMAIYDNLMSTIRDSYKANRINKKEYNLLFNANNSDAIDIIEFIFESEMQKPKCDDNKINTNKDGLDYILASKNPSDKNESPSKKRISELCNMHDQYKDIMKFCEKNFSATPTIKTDNGKCKWTPFSYYINIWNSEKNNHSEGKYFSEYFSKIDKVKNLWESYDNIISQSRDNYYTELSSIIESYFNALYEAKGFADTSDNLTEKYNGYEKSYNQLIEDHDKYRKEYDTINENYKSIQSYINDINEEIEDHRVGSNKYDKYKKDKGTHIKKAQKGNPHNESIRNKIDDLEDSFKNYINDREKLDEEYNTLYNSLREYHNELQRVKDKYVQESSFDLLDTYYSKKNKDIMKLSSKIPSKWENNCNSYINDLNSYSEKLNEIIKSIDKLQ